MDDVMDLYDRLPPTDMLSLEEMIERDMRSEHFENDGSCSQMQRHHYESCGANDYYDDSMTLTPSGGRYENGGTRDILDSDLFYLDDDERNDLPWFNMTNTNNGNEDFDPRTVLVNPNTGLRAADESSRSDSGEEESISRPLCKPVKPSSLVECDDTMKTVNNRHRLFIRNGGNFFKVNKDADSSESETSDDDDDDEKGEEFKFDTGPPMITKVFSSANSVSKTISNGPIGLLPLRLSSAEHTNRVYPKPAYSYSCLIAIALKNSQTGNLPVSEIYTFMIKTFPYFKTAPNGWKNSVRHNLSLNKCFEKIDTGNNGSNQRKGCLWGLNPNKAVKMDEEVQKWNRKDPNAIRKSMARPETLELLEKGALKMDLTDEETKSMLLKVRVANGAKLAAAEDVDLDSEDDSDSEESLDTIEPLEVKKKPLLCMHCNPFSLEV